MYELLIQQFSHNLNIKILLDKIVIFVCEVKSRFTFSYRLELFRSAMYDVMFGQLADKVAQESYNYFSETRDNEKYSYGITKHALYLLH